VPRGLHARLCHAFLVSMAVGSGVVRDAS